MSEEIRIDCIPIHLKIIPREYWATFYVSLYRKQTFWQWITFRDKIVDRYEWNKDYGPRPWPHMISDKIIRNSPQWIKTEQG